MGIDVVEMKSMGIDVIGMRSMCIDVIGMRSVGIDVMNEIYRHRRHRNDIKLTSEISSMQVYVIGMRSVESASWAK